MCSSIRLLLWSFIQLDLLAGWLLPSFTCQRWTRYQGGLLFANHKAMPKKDTAALADICRSCSVHSWFTPSVLVSLLCAPIPFSFYFGWKWIKAVISCRHFLCLWYNNTTYGIFIISVSNSRHITSCFTKPPSISQIRQRTSHHNLFPYGIRLGLGQFWPSS